MKWGCRSTRSSCERIARFISLEACIHANRSRHSSTEVMDPCTYTLHSKSGKCVWANSLPALAGIN